MACPFTPVFEATGMDAVQVLTFHTKAWSSFVQPTRRMPLGPYQDIARADLAGRVIPRFRHHLIRFRRFVGSSLALTSLDRACRNHCPDVSVTLTTKAFDRSSSRWLGISDLIAEPEGPYFISRTVVHSRVDRLHFDTRPTTVIRPSERADVFR